MTHTRLGIFSREVSRMLDVLISIRPEWCDMIRSGEKTVEIRKNMPKIETPFRCFIYQTGEYIPAYIQSPYSGRRKPGRVIGEFTCDRIDPIHVYRDGAVQNWMYAETDRSGLTYEEVAAYIGKEKTGYAWHISDLKIYDRPKHLEDFHKPGAPTPEELDESLCHYCSETDYGEHKMYGTPDGPVFCEGAWCEDAYQEYLDDNGFTLTRPPQSWYYVEER